MKTILLWVLLIPFIAFGSQDDIDKLSRRLSAATTETNKVDAYKKLGEALFNEGNYDETIKNYKELITFCHKNQQLRVLAWAHNEIGNCYADMGNNTAAFNYYQKSLVLAEPSELSLRAIIHKNIGAIFLSWKNLNQALIYYSEAQKLAQQASDKKTEADCLNNKGTVYEQQHKYQKAFQVYSDALAIYKREKLNPRIALTYNNLAILSKVTNQLHQAAVYYREAVKYAAKSSNAWITAAISNNLGNLLIDLDKTEESEQYLKQSLALSQSIGAKELIFETLENLAENAGKKGDYKSAFNYHKEFSKAKYEFMNAENTKEVNKLQTELTARYETEKKEKALAKSRSAYLQSVIEINRKNNLLLYAILGLGLLVAVAVVIFLNAQNKHRKIRQEGDFNLQLANSEARNQMQEEKLRISRELHDNIGSQLTFINSSIQILNKTGNADINVLTETQKVTQNTIAELRRTVWLINKEEVSINEFVIKLRDYLRPYEAANLGTKIDISYAGDCLLKSIVVTNLFRIIQESVNNALKYAQATQLYIDISCSSNSLNLTVNDNGLGFILDQVDQGYGLKNLNARAQALAGSSNVNSVVGAGTKIEVVVPL